MQDVFVEKPYQFVSPLRGTTLPKIIRDFELFRGHLRRTEGVCSYECRHADRLQKTVENGDAVMLTPNHSRTADPVVMGFLCKEARTTFYAMASWHLFNQGWFYYWMLRIIGAFSVNREGIDRQAIDKAISVLETAERPLIIFPEGTASRINDRLLPLLDGTALIARTAAKRRKKKTGGRVLIHPIALKYRFEGDLDKAVIPVLDSIEKRLSWRVQSDQSILSRIRRIGETLLALKEIEYFGKVADGNSLADRQKNLLNRLLEPLETKWLKTPQQGGVISRIKGIRMKILPEMINEEMSEENRKERWRDLEDTYLAQQISCYPEDYLAQLPSVDRILETVERFEEDLTDKVRVHGKLKVIIHVDEAIEVSPERDRKAAVDPLMQQIQTRLQSILDELALESPLYQDTI